MTKPLLDRLDSEAVNWSATCGDLFGEAAAEIRRLRAALRKIADRTEDHKPPFRVMSVAAMAQIAENTLADEQSEES